MLKTNIKSDTFCGWDILVVRTTISAKHHITAVCGRQANDILYAFSEVQVASYALLRSASFWNVSRRLCCSDNQCKISKSILAPCRKKTFLHTLTNYIRCRHCLLVFSSNVFLSALMLLVRQQKKHKTCNSTSLR